MEPVKEVEEVEEVIELVKEVEEVIEPVKDVKEVKEVIKKNSIVLQRHLPVDQNLGVITIDTIDYYLDNTNNNVYQMVNGDDIGIFLGVYDSILNCINQM